MVVLKRIYGSINAMEHVNNQGFKELKRECTRRKEKWNNNHITDKTIVKGEICVVNRFDIVPVVTTETPL